MLFTFLIVSFSYIFFRAADLNHAFEYISGIFSMELFTDSIQDLKTISIGAHIIYVCLLVVFFVLIEWVQRNKDHSLQFNIDSSHRILRHIFYYTLIVLMILYRGGNQEFIYFQF